MSTGELVTREVAAADVDVLEVSLPAGRIRLRPAADGGIRGTLTASAEAQELITVEVRGRVLVVGTDPARCSAVARGGWQRLLETVELVLEVPEGTDLDCRTGAGEVDCTVPLGRVTLSSGSGRARLLQVRDTDARSGAGTLTIDRVTRSARLTTGAGRIELGTVTGPVQATTGAGSIEVGRLEGPLQASSAAGQVSVAQTTESVRARTAAGSISVGVADGVPALLDLRTGLGRVRVDLEPAGPPAEDEHHLQVHARSAMGDIHLFRA
ncbi:DUF4097 family beta strand repeat-containing protein [Auraticoccus cholistanensis]|uniref:DUF4097 family beta strand repeat-containing protein n=1 Tax=Auraticoccus cholistanensis TaxID=2656650 RepID=UPI0018D23806